MVLSDYVRKTRPEPVDNGHDALFLSKRGTPITANAIKLIFSRLSTKSGVKRLHAHLCRHTFAINYLLNGGDIFSLKEILGHTTLEMVNHCLHFTRAQITLSIASSHPWTGCMTANRNANSLHQSPSHSSLTP
jgi:site-specific recombinase XerD